MNSSFISIAMLVGSVLLGGCANTASFDAKDGHYVASGRSTNPEAMMTTLSVNRAREVNSEAYADAVRDGKLYPNMMGPSNAFVRDFCPGGVCPQMLAPAVVTPGAQAPANSAAPSTDSAAKPVTREELDQIQKNAAEARKRADSALRGLKAISEDGDDADQK
jgi:hypothetical protein